MEIGGHIRVHPHMTYHLGAAKLVVTGGQNVIFWHFRALKYTIPLKYYIVMMWQFAIFLQKLILKFYLSTNYLCIFMMVNFLKEVVFLINQKINQTNHYLSQHKPN